MAEPIIAGDIHHLVTEGYSLLQVGDNFEARQRFRRALEQDPQHADALVGLAQAVLPYRERREYLQRALQAEPTHPQALAMLADVTARLAAGEVLAPKPKPPAAPVSTLNSSVVVPPSTDPLPIPSLAVCYLHPTRETGLYCTNCNRPICAECIRRAAVGQLCPECSRVRRPTNYQVGVPLLVGIGALSLISGFVLSLLTLYILGQIPFFSLIVGSLVAPIVADGYVRLIDRLTRAKRGREMQLAVAIGIGAGFAPVTLLLLLAGFGAIFGLLLQLLVASIIIVTAYRRLQ